MSSKTRLAVYRAVYAAFTVTGSAALGASVALVIVDPTAYPMWLALCAAVALVFAVAVAGRIREFHRHRHIPGPTPGFFLGALPYVLANEHGGRDTAITALHRVYGEVVMLHLAWGSPPFVSISRGFRQIHDKSLESNRRADKTILGTNLMGIDTGDTHRARRAALRPLLRADRVAARLESQTGVLDRVLDRWEAGDRDSIHADVLGWSVDSLGRFLCGDDWALDDERDDHRYHAAIAGVEESISFRTFHPPFVRYLFPRAARRATLDVRYLRRLAERMLRSRVEREPAIGEPADVLGLMARLAGPGYVDHKGALSRWTEQECVGEIVSLLAGGTDAINHVASQALHLLAANPGVQRRVHGALSGPAADRARAEIAVVHETIRMAPPLPFSSKYRPDGSFEALGYAVPAGTNIMPLRPAMGRNPAHYHQPDDYKPERFAGGCPHAESIKAMVPFGAGPRICVGQALATALCGDFVGRVLERFALVLRAGVEVEYSSTIAVKASALPVALEPRVPSASTAAPAIAA